MFTQAQIAALMQAFQMALSSLASAPEVVTPPAPTPVPVALPVAPPAWTAGIPAGFDEQFYLSANPDVANAVTKGYFTSGAHHYVLCGKSEGRAYAAVQVAAPIVQQPIVKLAPVATPTQITYSAGPSGWRVDDVVPSGTPGTVTLPKTGHVLSLPQPNPADPPHGEMFIGYVARVHKQCGDPTFPQGLGSLFLGVGHLFDPARPWDAAGTYWPEAADKYYNQLVYETPYERELRLRSVQQWSDYDEAMKKRGEAQAGQTPTPATTSTLPATRPHGGFTQPPAPPVTPPPAPPVGEDVPIG
jgi:hypothetical protein